MAIAEKSVQGVATPGDKVFYCDVMNLGDTIWEVMTTPEDNTHPKFGFSKGYGLMSEDGQVKYSDLRQNGWKFA